MKNVVLIVVSKHLLNYFHTHVTKIVVGTVVPTMIVGTAGTILHFRQKMNIENGSRRIKVGGLTI